MRPAGGAPRDAEGALALVREYLAERQPEGAARTAVVPLSGDASTRRYYRLRDGGPQLRPRALPGALPARGAQLPRGPRAPRVVRAAGARDRRRGRPAGHRAAGGPRRPHPAGRCSRTRARPAARTLYREAVDEIARLQREAAQGPQTRGLLPDRLRHREALLGAALLPEALPRGPPRLRPHRRGPRDARRRRSTSSAAEIASWPRVLCHRDYHSRNLMQHAGRLYWIDFQDARMGPGHLRPRLAAARLLRGRARGVRRRSSRSASGRRARPTSRARSSAAAST